MAPQFRLIMHAAQAEPFERAAQWLLRWIAPSWSSRHLEGADQAENRRLGRWIQFQHRQMFDDPFLYFFDAVVVVFEDLTHLPSSNWIFEAFFQGSSSTRSR